MSPSVAWSRASRTGRSRTLGWRRTRQASSPWMGRAEAELARSAAFIISAAEGGNQSLPALRSQPERFEPNSRERLLAGAMIPSAWYLQAQRFRRHAQPAC